MGVYAWNESVSVSGQPDSKTSGTMVNLLWSNSLAPGGVNPYAAPSLSFHGVVAHGFTLGGSLGYASATGELKGPTSDGLGNTTTQTQDLGTLTLFTFAPRVGYILSGNEWVSVWFRGGITYFSAKEKTTDLTNTRTGVGLSLDPMLVVTPIPHVGFLVGPTVDIGLSGSEEAAVALGLSTTGMDGGSVTADPTLPTTPVVAGHAEPFAASATAGSGTTLFLQDECGPRTPWNRSSGCRGGGISAERRASSSTGSITRWELRKLRLCRERRGAPDQERFLRPAATSQPALRRHQPSRDLRP